MYNSDLISGLYSVERREKAAGALSRRIFRELKTLDRVEEHYLQSGLYKIVESSIRSRRRRLVKALNDF
jgi:hypothetical protein